MPLPERKPSQRVPSIFRTTWLQKLRRFLVDKLLLPPAALLGVGVLLRNWAYNLRLLPVRRLPVRVIAVGNLSAGGTGKTPLAEYLLAYYQAAGQRPAYLSRGYGRQTKGYRRVDTAADSVYEVGDEALQVAMRFPDCPVAVGEQRWQAAQQLLQAEPGITHLILDDAYQHRAIHRDLNILTIDANRPPWRDHLMPRGRLREWYSSIRRAHLIIVNKVNDQEEVRLFRSKLRAHRQGKLAFAQVEPICAIPLMDHYEQLALEALYQRPVVAFSGLANNEQFNSTLNRVGVSILRYYTYHDHHIYTEQEVKRMTRRFDRLTRKDIYNRSPILLTTAKDAIRLLSMQWFYDNYAAYPFYFLHIGLDFVRGGENVETLLNKQLAAHATH
jgi:tetraacyldisaccharide 4'-kinase